MMLQVVEDVPVIKLSMIELSACELQMMLQVVEDVPNLDNSRGLILQQSYK